LFYKKWETTLLIYFHEYAILLHPNFSVLTVDRASPLSVKRFGGNHLPCQPTIVAQLLGKGGKNGTIYYNNHDGHSPMLQAAKLFCVNCDLLFFWPSKVYWRSRQRTWTYLLYFRSTESKKIQHKLKAVKNRPFIYHVFCSSIDSWPVHLLDEDVGWRRLHVLAI
jgi:hypothetical protein